MLYNYVALAFFALFAVFIPASFIIASKLLQPKARGNPVKNAPYESAEKTAGSARDLDIEYLPFFMLFLPFEVAAVLLLVWGPVAGIAGRTTGLLMIGLLAMATVLALAGYYMIGEKDARS